MIKSALKVYGKNIWNVFAILGFVSLGIFVGIFVVVPVINNLVYNTYNRVVAAATNLGQGFTLKTFIESLNSQLDALDWANPIRTLKILFEKNGMYNIIINALKAANLDSTQISRINEVILNSVDTLANGFRNEIIIFLSCVLVASVVGYVLTKVVVQVRSTYDHHILRFIISFVINFLILILIYYLILISLVSVGGVGLFFSLFAVFILMLLLTFISAILCYKKKDIKFFDLFNLKTNLGLILSSLIIFAISTVVIVLIFIFSDVVAILLSLPLFLITMIIIENIVINFVSGYCKDLPQPAEENGK